MPSPFDVAPPVELEPPGVPLPDPNAAGETGSLTEPRATDVVDDLILPRVRALADAALDLQNAVLLRCAVPDVTTNDRVAETFGDAVRAAGGIVGLGFGSSSNALGADMLLTAFAETDNSQERVAVLIRSLDDMPTTLAALRGLEPVLMGLPALEHVLLAKRRDERACALAVTVAANVQEVAARMKRSWTSGTVDPYWLADADEGAGRRRLRDLIEGLVRAVERIEANLDTASDGSGSLNLPFRTRERNGAYLEAILGTMDASASVLAGFAGSQTAVDDVVSALIGEIEAARTAFAAWRVEPNDSDLAAAFRRTLADLSAFLETEVADAFGFAPATFERPVVPAATRILTAPPEALQPGAVVSAPAPPATADSLAPAYGLQDEARRAPGPTTADGIPVPLPGQATGGAVPQPRP